MKKSLAILTAAGIVNLTWGVTATTHNPDHEDKSDPGFAVVAASTANGTAITITIQHAITGDQIDVPRVIELTKVSNS